jgi:hypothetical protein
MRQGREFFRQEIDRLKLRKPTGPIALVTYLPKDFEIPIPMLMVRLSFVSHHSLKFTIPRKLPIVRMTILINQGIRRRMEMSIMMQHAKYFVNPGGI